MSDRDTSVIEFQTRGSLERCGLCPPPGMRAGLRGRAAHEYQVPGGSMVCPGYDGTHVRNVLVHEGGLDPMDPRGVNGRAMRTWRTWSP